MERGVAAAVDYKVDGAGDGYKTPIALSGKSVIVKEFPKDAWISDDDDMPTFPDGWKGNCVPLQSGLYFNIRGEVWCRFVTDRLQLLPLELLYVVRGRLTERRWRAKMVN